MSKLYRLAIPLVLPILMTAVFSCREELLKGEILNQIKNLTEEPPNKADLKENEDTGVVDESSDESKNSIDLLGETNEGTAESKAKGSDDIEYVPVSGNLCPSAQEAYLLTYDNEVKPFIICQNEEDNTYYLRDRRGPFFGAENLRPQVYLARDDKPITNLSLYQSSYRSQQPFYVRGTTVRQQGKWAGSPRINYYSDADYTLAYPGTVLYLDNFLADYERGYITEEEARLLLNEPYIFSLPGLNCGYDRLLYEGTMGLTHTVTDTVYNLLDKVNSKATCEETVQTRRLRTRPTYM